ncbi:MAG: hypothetical protein BJ554DRAFT_3638 [Olpidium bornovanus]|uniref:Uncharacterized protein n=1 Tax=Olpidium bornovanus TaxID=278681 RepID=A0A8H7ZNW6_9FUNG|nr:MAG: hypothetical protein BJ554DRAFT_3638 [Olpidium bornovanus]
MISTGELSPARARATVRTCLTSLTETSARPLACWWRAVVMSRATPKCLQTAVQKRDVQFRASGYQGDPILSIS